MRKIHLTLIATLIAAAFAAVGLCPRVAEAQGDSAGASSVSVSPDQSNLVSQSDGVSQSSVTESSTGASGAGRTGGVGQPSGTSQSSGAAQTGGSTQVSVPPRPVGAGLPSGTEDEGPIQKGSNEFEVYTGGGWAPSEAAKGDGVWNVGLRYGRVMTGPFMPGKIRGYFESAWDVMPVFVVYQPNGPDYGFAVDTIDLKYVYDVHGPVVPYWEFTGGLLFTKHIVPQPPLGSSAFNFMPQAAAGVHVFSGRFVWSAEIRFLHISDAGIREPNDGVSTLEWRISFGQFRPPHKKATH